MAVKSQPLGPGLLTLTVDGGTEAEWSQQVRACSIVPSRTQDDPLDVLSGEQIAGDASVTFALTATFLQDVTTAGILAWSWANADKEADFVFVPNKDETDTQQWAGRVTITELTVGGDVKARNTSDAEWQCIGRPTPSAYVAA